MRAWYSSSSTQTRWIPPGLSGELDLGRLVGDEARAESLGLVAELLHHRRAVDAVRVAREVLDVGRLLEQAAPGEALDHDRA